MWALDTEDGSAVPVRLSETGKAIASFAEDEAGELYLVTFNNEIAKLVRR